MREKAKNAAQPSFFEFYHRDVTDGTRSFLHVPLTRSQRSFTNGHFCGENREHRAACFYVSCSGFLSSSIEDDDLDAMWFACSTIFASLKRTR